MSSKKIIEHFSNRAPVYDKTKWVNDEEILSSILKCINIPANSPVRILDLGAGTGAVSKYILKNGTFKKEITAVDICDAMLRQIDEPQIKKCIASAEKLPFMDNSFDVVISRQCLHYVENLDNAISEIVRVLKSEGIFVLSQLAPYESETKEYWIKLMKYRQPLRRVFFSEKDWIDLLTSYGFQMQVFERYSIRYSMKNWTRLYNVLTEVDLDKYMSLIEDAPEQYRKEYNVKVRGEDIWTTAPGITVSFLLKKADM